MAENIKRIDLSRDYILRKQEYLEAIENKSQRMSDLINLLFEYVKLDSTEFSLNKE